MPLTSSQPELDARFAVFLNPIRDLTKNWEVDISKYLEEYLEELAEIRISFDGGETMMNFAEAAMLIQGSAAVYCKKVEFLWQMVLQMLDLLSSKKSFQTKDMESMKEGEGSRQSKTLGNVSLEFESLEMNLGKNINMKEDDDDSVKGTLKFLPNIPLHIFEKENEQPAMRIPLSLKNKEVFGNKEDYLINRSYLSISGVLCMDIPSELLELRTNENHQLSVLSSPFEVPEPQASPKPMDGIEEDFGMPVSPIGEDFIDNEDIPKELGEPPPLPIPVDPEPSIVTVGRTGLRERKAATPNISSPKQIPLKDPWKPMDPHLESPSKRPVRAGRIRKPLPCSCHAEKPQKNKRARTSKKGTKDDEQKGKVKTIQPLDSYICEQLASLVTNNNTKISKTVSGSCLMEELVKEGNKRKEMAQKLSKTKDKGAITELDPDPCLEDAIEDPENEPNFEDIGDMDMEMPDPHGNSIDTPQNNPLNDTLQFMPSSDYEALVQKWVSDYVSNAQEHIASSELTKRVNRWKKMIMPALEVEDTRQSFDIHSYGTNVLSYFPEGNSKDTHLFEDIVKDEDPKEVCRIFLSCLMLANTGNLHLSKTKDEDLAMDCLELRILSRVRHHKQLEEYSAPNEVLKPTRNVKDKRKKSPEGSSEESGSSPKLKKKSYR